MFSSLVFLAISVKCLRELQQCGGSNYRGPTNCDNGLVCTRANEWWSDCQKNNLPAPGSLYAQCNGQDFTGTRGRCNANLVCTYINHYWSDCNPGSGTQQPQTPPPQTPAPENPPPAGNNGANPFVGATRIVDPKYAGLVRQHHDESRPNINAMIRPTAVWITETSRLGAIEPAMNLARADQRITVTEFVVYNLPKRDCAAGHSAGRLQNAGEYRQFIDAIFNILNRMITTKTRVVLYMEPDSLMNIVTNMSIVYCREAAPLYREGIKYALQKFQNLRNTWVYLDIGLSLIHI
jgi:hypothetical protein